MTKRTEIEFVDRQPGLRRTAAVPTFPRPSEFQEPWWREKFRVESTFEERWLSAMRAGKEVARVKLTFHKQNSASWPDPLPDGLIEIGAFEVAPSERGNGAGRVVLQALRHAYPIPLMVAWTTTPLSQGFWEAIGWNRRQTSSAEALGADAAFYVCPIRFG